MLGCQRRHEFSDSNAWTALTDVPPKEFHWALCTGWRLSWYRMLPMPVSIQSCESPLLVPGGRHQQRWHHYWCLGDDINRDVNLSIAKVNPGYAKHAGIEAWRPIGTSITMVVCVRTQANSRNHLVEICCDLIRIRHDIIFYSHWHQPEIGQNLIKHVEMHFWPIISYRISRDLIMIGQDMI